MDTSILAGLCVFASGVLLVVCALLYMRNVEKRQLEHLARVTGAAAPARKRAYHTSREAAGQSSTN
jgi:hypothetical protein